MQRELEFRAYSHSSKKMMDWNFIKSVGNLTKLIGLNHVDVMQLSPFKDTDGKKIYEGDIIGYWYDCDGVKKLSTETVFFDETTGQWMLDESIKQDRSHSISLYAELNDYDYFVQGNIYENPELLNQ